MVREAARGRFSTGAVGRTMAIAAAAAGLLGGGCREDFNDHGDPATFRTTFEVVAEGNALVSEPADPSMFLARTKREGQRAARRAGIDEIAELLASWTDYRNRALIVVLGNSLADANARLLVERLDAPAFSELTIVWARLDTAPEPASPVQSIPWLVVSAPAQDVLPTEECVLRIGREEVRSRCVLRGS
jgi:hypothetical protein